MKNNKEIAITITLIATCIFSLIQVALLLLDFSFTYTHEQYVNRTSLAYMLLDAITILFSMIVLLDKKKYILLLLAIQANYLYKIIDSIIGSYGGGGMWGINSIATMLSTVCVHVYIILYIVLTALSIIAIIMDKIAEK